MSVSSFHMNLSKNKSFEWQLNMGCDTREDRPFDLSLRLTEKQDHAGPDFVFGIKHLFWLHMCIYDHRHWDDERDCWQEGGESP